MNQIKEGIKLRQKILLCPGKRTTHVSYSQMKKKIQGYRGHFCEMIDLVLFFLFDAQIEIHRVRPTLFKIILFSLF